MRPSLPTKNMETDPALTFNGILGEVGPFQIWTSFLIVLSGIVVSWETLSFAFLARDVSLICIDPVNSEPCSIECVKVSGLDAEDGISIIYEWGLYCEKMYKREMAQTALFVGIMCGCVLYGHLADQIGRRPTFISACMVVLVMGVAVGISPWYWFFCLTRFFLGFGCGGMTIICIVFLVEYVDFGKREFMVIMYRLPQNIGHGTLPALSFFLQKWRYLQLMTSAFGAIYIIYYWLLPESPRWLFVTGQIERCIRVLRTGARQNNMPTENIRTIVETAYDDLRTTDFTRHSNMIDLFKSQRLRKKTCILCFAWFSLYFKFFGVSEYLSYMTGNIYVNFGVSAWLTIPGTIVAYPVIRFVTRRRALLSAFGISAICLLTIPMLPHYWDQMWSTMLSTFVVALTSISFVVMDLYSAELFPTILRNSGMGLCICIGRLGCLMATYVYGTSPQDFWTPALIYGILSLISAFSLLFLPETKNKTLPDTIEDSEKFRDL